MATLQKHVDGEWWTSEYEYGGRKILIKMRRNGGSKIHIFSQDGKKVEKTFRYIYCAVGTLFEKAKTWINKQKQP